MDLYVSSAFLSLRPASATRGKVTLDLIAEIIHPSVF